MELRSFVIKSNYSSAYNLNYFETKTKSAKTFVPRKSANFRLELPWVLATSVSWFPKLPGPTSSPFWLHYENTTDFSFHYPPYNFLTFW